MTAKIAFHEEVMFSGYRDSNSSGPVTSFLLSDAAHLELFRGLAAAKGGKAGHRFYMTLVEIHDDETTDTDPVEPAHGKPGPLCVLALQWCRDERFQRWVPRRWRSGAERISEEECRAHILDVCHIASRRELDTVPSAANAFNKDFRGPFMAYMGDGK